MTRLSAFALSVAVLPLLAACGGNSSSGGGASTGVNSASGVMSLPSATCGDAACMSATGMSGGLATSSRLALQENADYGYKYINTTFVPMVNQKMYEIEQLFIAKGLDQCGSSDVSVQDRQIDQVPNGTYTLSSTMSAVVTSTSLWSAPYSMEKKFLVSASGTPFLEVQVGCPDANTRSIYVRLKDGTSMFEAWGHKSLTSKAIYAASDVGSSKRTLYFKSTSSSVFEIGAIAKDASLNGDAPVTLSISGGASLMSGTGKLEVNLLMNPATALSAASGGTSYDTDDLAYSGTGNKRHCYTALDPAVVTTTASNCASLFAGPSTAYLRGGSRSLSDWSVNTLGSAAISTTF